MLCDYTETARRLRCKCAEIALRIDSQWSRSQIRQSVGAALCSHVHDFTPSVRLALKIFLKHCRLK